MRAKGDYTKVQWLALRRRHQPVFGETYAEYIANKKLWRKRKKIYGLHEIRSASLRNSIQASE